MDTSPPEVNIMWFKGKMDQQQRQDLIEQGKVLKEKLAELEERLGVLENQLQMEGQKLPNMTHPEVWWKLCHAKDQFPRLFYWSLQVLPPGWRKHCN